jgi:opacity protein-like surface antigen
MQNILKLALLSLSITFASIATADCDCDEDKPERKLYLGIEGGWSAALKKSFIHKETKVTGSLKSSPFYGGIVGYRFYPGMAIEANFQHKPKYFMNFVLPAKDLESGAKLAKTPGKVKVISNIYMIGLTYDFPEFNKIVPYVGIDAGLAQIKTKYLPLKGDIQVAGTTIMKKEVFRIKNKSNISPAAQLTIGLSSEIATGLRLNLAGRIQVIKDAKISYEEYNPKTDAFDSKKLKQTLGVSEIVVGLTYDLPI